MKTIITSLLIAISFIGFAQKRDSVTIRFRTVTDTVQANIIIINKDGLLQRKTGKVIRKVNVFDNPNLQSEVMAIFYFDDNWAAIKEEIFDVKSKK